MGFFVVVLLVNFCNAHLSPRLFLQLRQATTAREEIFPCHFPPRWQRDAGTDREADGGAAQHTGATGKAAGGAPMPVQELGAEKPACTARFGREGLKKPKLSTRNTRRVHLVAFLKPRAA